jgi:hypothetical protein
VFDVGGRGDKSFNDAAYAGLDSAKRTLGIEFQTLETGEGADREAAMRQLAATGSQLVFGVGFLFSDDIKSLALEFPDVKFACVDYTVKEGETLPPNLLALKFKEEEGSYLVGALAALLSKTGTVGFVGGMEIPLIKKFEAGYRAGVAAVTAAGARDREIRGHDRRGVQGSDQGQGAGALRVSPGRGHHLPRVGLDRPGRVRGGARAEEAGDRRGFRSVRRGPRRGAHLDGEARRGRGVQHHPRDAGRALQGRRQSLRPGRERRGLGLRRAQPGIGPGRVKARVDSLRDEIVAGRIRAPITPS